MAGDRVGARGSSGQSSAIGSPKLTGRADELETLRETLGRPPALILVEGEAGIGKSRLLRELLAGRSGPYVVTACPPFREPYTLGPLVDAVRQATDDVAPLGLSTLAGALRPLFPEWAADLPPMPEPAEDATAARHRLFRALGELLTRLEISVVVLEDVHWADEATLEFLLYLVSHQPSPPSVVLTYRPEDVPENSLLLRLSSRTLAGWSRQRIVLHALDIPQTAELVSSMVGGEQVSAEFASFLHERSDGVPLVVEELVRLLHDRADLFHRDSGWVRRQLADIDVPPTIRDAVLERVGQLDDDARTVLTAAAVVSAPVDEASLAAITELPAERSTAAVTAALASRMLQEDGGGLISFRHVLACRAVYDATPARERRALHLLAGRTLERLSPQPATQLARHYREAGQTGSWCRYAEAAADLALASGDETAAITLLHDVVVNAEVATADVIRLTAKIPFGSFTGGERFSDLLAALRAVLDRPGLSRAEWAEARIQLGRVLMLMEEYEDGRAEIEQAIPALGHAPAAAAKAMTLLGWPRDASWPAGRHLGWLHRAAATVTPSVPAVDRRNLAVERATGMLMLGSEEGWVEADRILAGGTLDRHPASFTVFHLNIGDQAVAWGRYDEARQRLDQALALAEQHGYTRFGKMINVTRASLDWFTCSWSGLAERVEELATDQDIQPVSRLEAVLVRGLLEAVNGDPERAREDLRTVLSETRRRGAVSNSILPAASLARLALVENQVDVALEVTDEPIELVWRKQIWVWAADLAPTRIHALVRAGRLDEAARTVDAFAAGLEGRYAPAPAAALLVCRGLLAEAGREHARAAALFGEASLAWDALPRPYEAVLMRQREARCRLALGDDTALPSLSEAFQRLSDLGATRVAGVVQGILREHGVTARVRGRGGRPSYGDQLSPRELDVVALVVDGLTNRQIADALVLSTQTVASHLHSAMRKLQVTSRTSLAVSLVERGLVAGRGDSGHRAR